MLFRKLLLLFGLAGACVLAPAARAQLGFFGTVTGERVSGIPCKATDNICAAGGGTVRPFGANFGAYYDFTGLGPARLGVELRGGVVNSNKSAEYYQSSTDLTRKYTFLAGPRAEFTTPFRWLRPYGEVLAGYARSNIQDGYQNYAQAEGVVGVDVPIGSFVDLRAIEFTAGGLFGPATHGMQSIGAGIVFHTTR